MPFFSGAEGYGGTFTGTAPTGGWFSNADVYHVTTTQDLLEAGKGAPGTLRGAFVDHTNPNSPKQKISNRIVVFDVGGTFELTQGKLDIKEVNNIYVAGQTAPSPVTVYGNMTQITKSNNTMTSNVVLRYMTFRKGTGPEEDAISFTGGDGVGDTIATNMILDHVTASWSEDENLSVTNNNTNVTVQYSLIHDALVSNHAYGSLIRPKVDSNVSFHHNLYANNASRQARFGTYNAETLTADFRNNVVYNWRDRASYAGGSSEPDQESVDVNYVGNYLIAGPATASNANTAFVVDKNVDVQAYQSGNFIDSDKQFNPAGQPNGTNTGWGMFAFNTPITDQTLVQLTTPIATPAVTTQSANDAYWQIVNHVGNWWWSRDAIDSRVINNVLNNTNPPNGVAATAPNAAELNGVVNAPVVGRLAGWDSDNDGMPDSWEIAHGLNPNSLPASPDWKLDFDNDGFINLAEYINEAGEFPAPAPIVFNGSTNNRYAQITNWKTNDGGITAGSNWQPSKYDEAQINSGMAVVDSVGQHAGLVIIGANAGNNATLNVTGGWLKVADALVIGGDDGATATVNLSGGMLSAPTLAKGAGGTFNFTGGVLHAVTIGFGLQNQGGMFAPGSSASAAHVMGDLTLSSGSLQIEIASEVLSDTIQVDGSVMLGGVLDVALLGGFSPTEGDSWQILSAGGGILQGFASITPGYSVQQQGNSLVLYFGAAPNLDGDFNGDGLVDAADYVLWRKNDGTPAQYAAWRTNYGASVGSGSNLAEGAVPEPASLLIIAVAAVTGLNLRNRRLRLFGSFLQE